MDEQFFSLEGKVVSFLTLRSLTHKALITLASLTINNLKSHESTNSEPSRRRYLLKTTSVANIAI